jgi:signal transduction histidine kinase/CheY-like chemotaxis protein
MAKLGDADSLFVGTPEIYNLDGLFHFASQMQPKLRRVVLVEHLHTDLGITIRSNLIDSLVLPQSVQMAVWENLPFDTLLARASHLDPETDALFLGSLYYHDLRGRALSIERLTRNLNSKSRAPIYTFWEFAVQGGVVGADAFSVEYQGELAAGYAKNILNGAPLSSIGKAKRAPSSHEVLVADYEAMLKRNLSVANLPSNTLILNIPESWFRQNRDLVWASLLLTLAEAAVLAILLLWIRRNNQISTARLTEAKQAAEEAAAAKTVFLSTMSHEIRTPLNGVIGYSDLLSKTALNESQKEFVRTIQRSGHGLLDLINTILDYAKMESGNLELFTERVDIFNLCDEVIDLVRYRQEERWIDLFVMPSPELPRYLFVDGVRLKQILVNLLANALKFTEKGKVELTVTPLRDRSEYMPIRFEVTDTGIGIAKDKQESIFSAFMQADASTTRRYGGSGLGLSISEKLLEKMGSRIELESSPGRGSRFSFTLDIRTDDDSLLFRPLTAEPQGKIHVFHSDPNVREYTASLLTKLNLKPVPHKTIESLLDQAKESDLLLAEENHFDGETLYRIVNASRYPILFVKGKDRLSKLQAAYPTLNCVQSPVQLARLISVLRHIRAKNIEEEIKGPAANAPPIAKANIGSTMVLVIEDDPASRSYADHLIHTIAPGVRIVGAKDGQEGLKEYDRYKPCLVIMDIVMPVMDGYTCARKIREYEQANHIEPANIVALTARTSEGVRENCLEAGMNDYYIKPIIEAGMHDLLAKYL